MCRMDDGRISKEIMFGELATGTWPIDDLFCAIRMVASETGKSAAFALETLSRQQPITHSSVKVSVTQAEVKRENQ